MSGNNNASSSAPTGVDALLASFLADKNALQANDMKLSDELKTYDTDQNTATRHLGMEIELNNYNNSMLALTNPRKYAELRTADFKAMKDKIDVAFKAIYKELSTAGMSHEEAKAEAMEGAAREKDILSRAFYLKFPQDANAIAHKEHAKASSSEYLGISGVQYGGRAAPAKRTYTKRK